jgi:hypothetical protein
MTKSALLISLILLASVAYSSAAFSSAAFSNVGKSPQPLFESNEILTVTLELPFHALSRDRRGEPRYHDAEMSYETAEEEPVLIPVRVRTRGKTRRDPKICKFPPLRLRFTDETTVGTLFENQKNMKLVTHCQNQGKFDQYVLKEYLAYRIYNLITEVSIRARLIRIVYMEGGDEKATRFGILLENWRKVATRTGLSPLETTGNVDQAMLSAMDANQVSMFNYLISNDDWSIISPASNDECCHNTRPLLTSEGQVIPLPYDFDYSGLVNTSYSVAKSRNSNVRTRRYSGLCSTINDGDLSKVASAFSEKRAEIYDVVRSLGHLGNWNTERTFNYFDRFYDVINDPKQIKRKLIKRCRKK